MRINIEPNKILFLDIETIPHPEVSEFMQKSFYKKFNRDLVEEMTIEDSGALYPEYGKIACISVGCFVKKKDSEKTEYEFKTKSYCSNDERQLLTDFFSEYQSFNRNGFTYICGHNSKEFDMPFIIKRATINRIDMNCSSLEPFGKKPWELSNFLDTMEIWKAGSLRGTESLMGLCMVFNLPNPKEAANGLMVKDFYRENNFKAIADYCEGDVRATAWVFCAMGNFAEYEAILQKELDNEL